MMIAKMLLLVSVSSSRTFIKFDLTGGADNEKGFHFAANSAGHLQPSKHSSEVSLHSSLIDESKPKQPRKQPKKRPAEIVVENVSTLESEPPPPAAPRHSTQILQSLGPVLMVNAIRALMGGYTPGEGEIEQPNAAKVVGELVRVRNSDGKGNLFQDGFSEALAPLAWPVLDKMSAAPAMRQFLYATSLVIGLRTHFIDQEVRKAIMGGVKQVVYLGMGLDTRALRLAWDGVSVFEVDIGFILKMKVEAMKTHGKIDSEEYYPATLIEQGDLNHYIDALIDQGLDPGQRVTFVWESKSMYTDVEDTKALLTKIFDRFAGASVVFDSAEPAASSAFFEQIERTLGKTNMYPGKFEVNVMARQVSPRPPVEVEAISMPVTDYAKQEVTDKGIDLSSYFPTEVDEGHFHELFQNLRFNVMSLK